MTRPHISVNFAISADGRITATDHRASGWTSDADFARLKSLRENADALMVARGTLEADRMTLKAPHHPLRCLVSASGRFNSQHPIFRSEGGPIHLLGTQHAPAEIPGTHRHHQPLPDFLETLHRNHGIEHLHCEGGGQLVRELATLDLLDEIHLTWAGHTLFGGAEAPGITGAAADFLPASRQFVLSAFEPREELGECFLSYRRAQ